MKKFLSVLLSTVLFAALMLPQTAMAAKEFDVDGVTKSIENNPGFVNDTDPRLIYKGPWSKNQYTFAGGKPSNGGRDWTSFYAGGGRAYLAEVKGATVEFTFVGTSIMVLMTRYTDLGSVEFTLDEQPPVRVDLHCEASEADDNYAAFKKSGLAPGTHTIRMESVAMAEKTDDGKEKFGYIHLIGMVTDNGLVNSTNEQYVHTENFSVNEEHEENQMSCGSVGGDLLYTETKGSTLTFNFEGSYVGILSKVGKDFGKASVKIDGKDAGTIDLHAEKTAIQNMCFNQGGLSAGKHTLTLTTTEDKFFNVDALIISQDTLSTNSTTTLPMATVRTTTKGNVTLDPSTTTKPVNSNTSAQTDGSGLSTQDITLDASVDTEVSDSTKAILSGYTTSTQENNFVSTQEVGGPGEIGGISPAVIIIIVMVVLLLGIGGLALWLFYFKPKGQNLK